MDLGAGEWKIGDVAIDARPEASTEYKWNLNRFPYPKWGKYNSILMHHVLEHLDNPLAVLNEIKKMLNDSGRVIVVVPAESQKTSIKRRHIHRFNRKSLTSLLKTAGFINIKIIGYIGDTRNTPIFFNKLVGKFIFNEYICIAKFDRNREVF